MRKNHRPKKTAAGTIHDSRSRSSVLSITRVYGTSYCDSRSARSGSTRLATITVLPDASGVFSRPVTVLSRTKTSATLPSASACSKAL